MVNLVVPCNGSPSVGCTLAGETQISLQSFRAESAKQQLRSQPCMLQACL